MAGADDSGETRKPTPENNATTGSSPEIPGRSRTDETTLGGIEENPASTVSAFATESPNSKFWLKRNNWAKLAAGTIGLLVAIGAWLFPDPLTRSRPRSLGPAAAIGSFVATGNDLRTEACNPSQAPKSMNSDTETDIQFINRSSGPIKVYWLNYNGDRTLYGNLKPGESQQFATYLAHPWLAADSSGSCIAIFYPDKKGGRAVIQGSSPTTSTISPQAELRDSLLSVVSLQEVRDTCFAQPDKLFTGALLSMECVSEQASVVRLALFSDKDSMNDAYNRGLQRAGVKRDSGSDACDKSKPGEGEWTLSNTTAGRLFCYFDGNRRAWMHWTYDDEKVYVYAGRNDGNMSALNRYWTTF